MESQAAVSNSSDPLQIIISSIFGSLDSLVQDVQRTQIDLIEEIERYTAGMYTHHFPYKIMIINR